MTRVKSCKIGEMPIPVAEHRHYSPYPIPEVTCQRLEEHGYFNHHGIFLWRCLGLVITNP